MDKQFNLIMVLEAIQKRLKTIVIVTLGVTLLTFIVTLPVLNIVKPEYKSKSIFYSANLSLTDRPYLFEGKSAVDIDFNLFGSSQDVDRLVSIAHSRPVMKHLVERFNLIEHYKIKVGKVKFPEADAISKLKKHFTAMKNEYNSVEVHMIDTDRQLAADIANEAVAMVDKINRSMVMEGRQYMISVMEKHTNSKKGELQDIYQKMDESTSFAERNTLEFQAKLTTEQLTHYYNVLDQFKLITTDDISTIRIMEKAYPKEKEEPTRYILIAAAFFGTLFILILGATILHVMSR